MIISSVSNKIMEKKQLFAAGCLTPAANLYEKQSQPYDKCRANGGKEPYGQG